MPKRLPLLVLERRTADRRSYSSSGHPTSTTESSAPHPGLGFTTESLRLIESDQRPLAIRSMQSIVSINPQPYIEQYIENVYVLCRIVAPTVRQVTEYMKQVGADKAPRLSTSGARYRDLQLTLQLPPHDLSSNHCRHLANKEQKEAFDEFCRVRDTDAMDIGYIANSGVKDDTVLAQLFLLYTYDMKTQALMQPRPRLINVFIQQPKV